MSLKDLKNRLNTVKTIHSITEAMRLISTSRFAQLKRYVNSTVPYTEEIYNTFLYVIARANIKLSDYSWSHDFGLLGDALKEYQHHSSIFDFITKVKSDDHNLLNTRTDFFKQNNFSDLENRELGKYDEVIILLTSNKGLCGQFNSMVIRELKQYLDTKDDCEVGKKSIGLICIGTKGYDAFKKHKIVDIIAVSKVPSVKLSNFADVFQYFTKHIFSYLSYNKVKSCRLFYAHFISLLKSVPSSFTIAPFTSLSHFGNIKNDLKKGLRTNLPYKLEDVEMAEKDTILFNDSYEPDLKFIILSLVYHSWHLMVYNALVSNMLSEYSSRMSAMDNAAKNSKDIINALTLKCNSLRQNMITSELLEIIAGSEAI